MPKTTSVERPLHSKTLHVPLITVEDLLFIADRMGSAAAEAEREGFDTRAKLCRDLARFYRHAAVERREHLERQSPKLTSQ